jgi:hypothetical protein
LQNQRSGHGEYYWQRQWQVMGLIVVWCMVVYLRQILSAMLTIATSLLPPPR